MGHENSTADPYFYIAGKVESSEAGKELASVKLTVFGRNSREEEAGNTDLSYKSKPQLMHERRRNFSAEEWSAIEECFSSETANGIITMLSGKRLLEVVF